MFNTLQFIRVITRINSLKSLALGLLITSSGVVFSFAANADSSQPERVLTSIRPLTLLLQDLVTQAQLNDQFQIHTLLQSSQSPHHFSLRLSDKRQLQDADLVVWVGESLEHFLSASLEQRDSKNTLELSALETVIWPPSKNDTAHNHSAHNDDHHNHNGHDPHLWLNPANAGIIASAFTRRYAIQYPQLVAANKLLQKQLTELTLQLRKLMPARNANPLVFHDSLGHFTSAMMITPFPALTEVPEQQIGLRHLLELNNGKPFSCLLADSSEIAQAKGYAKRLKLPLVSFDLLAGNMEIATYRDYLASIAADIEKCGA
ncbi:metal ABC transporter solute-binding protein, Zn/Mn family [Teredinibacter waterburyi]|jgi:ABC-type Zn2+ transport system, periplasmic component/surface adhesin|uniref:metal ABC transporter solute-binding protein, Zn/Mn family n=1 Tax=Teredinibacter waterburyi TaxID=1500538 RepID=UPI00165FAB87|nr:zinc ABC transporter substrate-binding protein [Teredinibacter waterburyi]